MTKASNTHTTTVSAPNPHQAPPVSIATRRDLFGAMGALLLLTAAEAGTAKAAELDGELLSCCAEVTTINQESDRLYCVASDIGLNISPSHPAWQAYEAYEAVSQPIWHETVARIAQLPARTPEGLRAKALTARSTMPGYRQDEPEPCDRLALSVFADVMGRAGA